MPEDEVDPITVTGKRRLWGIRFGPYSPPPEPPLPGDTAELPPTEPGEPQEHPEDREKKDCAAKEFREELEEENRDQSEYFSLIYKKDGQIFSTEIRTEGGGGISQDFMEDLMSEFGITRADVLGFSHNHNEDTYCNSPDSGTRTDQRRVNRYPSGNDWATFDWFVNGGADPADFNIYVMGCTGDEVRGFNGSLAAFYRGLSQSQKEGGFGLPPPVGGEACTPQEEE